jgi:hypothetical protein
MSSSPLYLAIVVVWLIVLVPMLLRKDCINGFVGGIEPSYMGGAHGFSH